ncbi:MAG TPA: alpha/beta fold hydrolase [Anaerovoracaceae bacterium]|nr:alpha/beta fold hydrolase [Anaerovoracaceae bacterium]
MYTKEIDSFLSSNKVDNVHFAVYIPHKKPIGIIQVSHGMAEHFGRYHEFTEFLVEKGFIVCGNDHLGHGNTAPSTSDLGYFGKTNGWINMTDDLYLLTQIMKDRFGDLPYFLIGHSMGSLLARAYLSCYGREITGAILIGTSGDNPIAKRSIPLVKFIARIKGERHRSKFIYSLAFGDYNRKYEKGSRKLAWMSQDHQVLDSFRADPRCNFIFTVSGFHDLMRLLVYVSRKDWASEVPIDLPVSLLSGDMDPVGDFGEGTRQVFKHLQMAKIKDLSLKLYPGMRHEILSEPGKEKVYFDILSWICKHVGTDMSGT